jgi:hypothetical protein
MTSVYRPWSTWFGPGCSATTEGQDSDGDGTEGQEQTDTDTDSGDASLTVAIARARKAIHESSGPTRRTLESVWLPEIQNALEGEGEAVRRLLEVWGDEPNDRPRLRIVRA